jgi:NAD(P)-dependent dehydrogenase (short-subunit alcohol dehydrogenase family)
MAVNERGVYLMSRAVAGHMVERGGGSVINMSS